MTLSHIDILCQQYLTILYHDVQRESRPTLNNICEVYGEILYAGIDKLISTLPFTTTDIFVDYGSGLGKIATQIFLKTPVKAVYGLEIVEELHQQAASIAEKLQQELPGFYENERKLVFVSGSFLTSCFTSVTIAIVVSTCFTQTVLNALGTIMDATPSIHTVLSLRPISTLHRLKFKKTVRIECSWDTALCYIYSNKAL